MRALTKDIKWLVTRLGPAATKALELAVRRAMSATHVEVTTEHLLRALLDLPDSDLSVSMEAARIGRVDVAARLDAALGRLKGRHDGKPKFSEALCLLLEDASKLTTEPVRTGHLVAALLADPTLSPAGCAGLFAALPRQPLYLLTSKLEDRGEVGRAPAAPVAPAAPAAPAASPPAERSAEPAPKAR
ncbi:MAG: hypothetical protein HY908_28990, partial [Myxococcales bacterium]|nr:hypothetical protein [Myxococcales bacterium]